MGALEMMLFDSRADQSIVLAAASVKPQMEGE
jgi:hypothetical protein